MMTDPKDVRIATLLESLEAYKHMMTIARDEIAALKAENADIKSGWNKVSKDYIEIYTEGAALKAKLKIAVEALELLKHTTKVRIINYEEKKHMAIS